MAPGVSTAVLLEQIKAMQADLGELKDLVKCINAFQGQFERDYIKAYGQVVERVNQAHNRQDLSDKKLESLEKRMAELEKLTPWIKVLAYLVTGLSIPTAIWFLTFLYLLFTNKVTLP